MSMQDFFAQLSDMKRLIKANTEAILRLTSPGSTQAETTKTGTASGSASVALNDLSDVTEGAPQDLDILGRDDGNSDWRPKTWIELGMLDEDDFVSDSATLPATQQSIKAFLAATYIPLTTFGTITNTPDIDQHLLTSSTPTFANLLLPGGDIGSTTSEIGDVFLADGKYIKWGSAQDWTVRESAGNLFIDSANATGSIIFDLSALLLIRDRDAGSAQLLNLDTSARTLTIGAGAVVDIIHTGNLLLTGTGGDDERLRLPYLTEKPGSADNASLWMESDGTLRGFTAGIEKIINRSGLAHSYIDIKERLSVYNIHGGLDTLATAQPLDSVPTDLPVTVGTGKIIVVINAGSDVTGSITVTGTSVDRDDGSETGADTDVLTVDTLSTDTSGTDSGGNPTFGFANAYITTKWFKGAVVLSTTNLTLSDVDVYQVSFEQFNDESHVTIDTFDTKQFANHTNANIYWHLYSVTIASDKATLTLEKSMELVAADVTANKSYRLRRSNLGISIDGATEGIFVQCYPEPLANIYWEDIDMKIWWN